MQDRYSLENAVKTCGVSLEGIATAASWVAQSPSCSLLFAMGITQHAVGVDNVRSCANLQMLTGNIGNPGGGVNPLRGQNNVQGACDMGCLPDVLPGTGSWLSRLCGRSSRPCGAVRWRRARA